MSDDRRRPSGETIDRLRGIVEGETGRRLRLQLAGWNPDFGSEQIEDAVQAACDRFLRGGCQGTSEPEIFTWLRTTAHRWLGHQRRDLRRREVLVDPAGHSLDQGVEDGPDAELIKREIEHDRVQLVREVVSELSERQRLVLALHIRGEKRPRIAARLAVSPRVVKREMEAVMAVARTAIGRLAGGGCPEGERLVMRRAYGLATPLEAAQARRHLMQCSLCGEFASRLDHWREGAAAILPGSATVERANPGRIADALASLRQHVADGSVQLKQQATAAYYRAADPTPLAGMRPGAVGAVVGACLVGTGTYAYCAEHGVNPLAAVPGLVQREGDQSPKSAVRNAPAEQPPPTVPEPAPTVAEPPPVEVTPQPAPVVTEQAASPVPAPPSPPPPPPPPEQQIEPNTYTPPTAQPSSATPAPVEDSSGVRSEFAGP